MADLKKAIKAVEYGIRAAEIAGGGEKLGRSSIVMMLTTDLDNILELLKAQEPRVMMITEAFDAEVAWLERYADPDDAVEPIIQPVIIKYYENGYWECLVEQDESDALTLFIEDFGTEFRFWTSRPTDEQREATPWKN